MGTRHAIVTAGLVLGIALLSGSAGAGAAGREDAGGDAGQGRSGAALPAVGVATEAVAPGSTDTRLVDAVRRRDHDALRVLLASRTLDVDAPGADGMTALHWAARGNDEDAIARLLARGANPNARTRLGVPPLLLAATTGGARATALLLAHGADPSVALPGGQTVLMHAARAGSLDVVRQLVARGAAVDAAEAQMGETALMWAAAENHGDVVTALADAGAAVDARSRVMTFSRQRFGDGRSARFTVLPRGGWTALLYAARQNAPAAVRALAAAGAGLDATDPDGTTALTLAVINAHYDLAATLLDLGANPNVGDSTGMTPLYAVVDMHTLDETPGRPAPAPSGAVTAADLVSRLLKHGANPNARLTGPILERVHNNPDGALGAGATPLMRAARKGDVALMRVLLEGGADPSARTARGVTPLLYASGFGGLGRFGEYDLTRATDDEFADAIRTLVARGASAGEADETGQTALHVAAAQRGEAVVRALLAAGARADATDAEGRTPLDVAMGRGPRSRGAAGQVRPEIVALLDGARTRGGRE